VRAPLRGLQYLSKLQAKCGGASTNMIHMCDMTHDVTHTVTPLAAREPAGVRCGSTAGAASIAR